MEVIFKPNGGIQKFDGNGDGVIELCPRCNSKLVGVLIPLRRYNFATCICRNCNSLFVIEGLGDNDLRGGEGYSVTSIPNAKSEYSNFIIHLPQDIQEDFKQAIICLETDCYDASITMSRRTLQHIARESIKSNTLTSEKNTLQKELECLKDNQIIFPKTFAMYEQIKNTGNFGAHPDEIDLNKHVTQEEAENAIRVVILMVKEIYENDELYNKIIPPQA